MARMNEATRVTIRVLYFVHHRPLREIAATLGLNPIAVRAALVLAGGDRSGTTPSDESSALQGVAPTRVAASNR